MNETRDQLERSADRIRDELMVTLKEIDRRRHLATNLRHQVEQHTSLVLGIGVGAVLLLGTWTGIALLRRRFRRRHRFERRMEGMKRAWRYPERLASRAPDAPTPLQLGRKVGATFLLALGTRLARRAAAELVSERPAGWASSGVQ